jgi:hypothetical protein
MIKSWRIRCVGYEACMGGKGKCTQYFDEDTIRGHLEYWGVTGRVILKCT